MTAYHDDEPLHADTDSGADPIAVRIASWYRADISDAQPTASQVKGGVTTRRRRAQRRRWAGCVGLAVVSVALARWRLDTRDRTVSSALDRRQPSTRFVYVATGAVSRVALVGDFNGWNPHATPLARVRAGTLWVVDVRVPIGPHAYAYVLNDNHWTTDPAAALLLTATATAAQDSADARLNSATAVAVERVIDSTAVDGLPIAALRAKASEGARRGAPNDRIIRVVAGFAARLRVARQILRASASDAELIALAGALTAGASKPAAESLVAAARAQPRPMPVTVPFVVATDLAARGVPADSALSVVQALLRRNGSETDLWTLRTAVARDIASGGDPLDALMVRSGVARGHESPPGSNGTRPPRGTP